MAYPCDYFEYYAETGDTFSSVASKFSVSEKELKALNDVPAITQGSRIKIPSKSGGCGRGVFYAIRRGDTLYRIAKRRGITVETLLNSNPFLNPSHYVPGQVIVLPIARQLIAYYTLGRNEKLSDVLRRYDMDISTFCTLNPGVNPLKLREGQRVKVRKSRELGRRYTVKEDDTLVSVADAFGIRVSSLLAANRDFKPSEFVPGVVLRIPAR
ncbi:MAG: LysM peptidoglycan-binding domain-containing protein [Burkholderiales bacterium]